MYLRARFYAPRQGRFLSRDSWEGDYEQPASYNKWLYASANPIVNTDPTGKWVCSGHPDCIDWVENALSALEASGETGKRLRQFFDEYDAAIARQQNFNIKRAIEMGGEYYDPCLSSRIGGGLLILFTDKPFPPSMSNVLYNEILQFHTSSYISGPYPTNWGIITLAHEISHYKQGTERFTIQGEMFAQYAGAQVWKDLGEHANDMPHTNNFELVKGHPENYKPFRDPPLNLGLIRAQNELAKMSWSYHLFPLYLIGIDENWMADLAINWYKSIKYKP